MPLSEEELRALEQMERALVEEDPKFASTLRGTSFRRAQRRRAVLAGLAFAVGVAVLMAGAVYELIPVGILGFVIMLASATYGLASLRGRATPTPSADPKETKHHGFSVIDGGGKSHRPHLRRGKPATGGPSGSFMQRMEERWRRRREQGY